MKSSLEVNMPFGAMRHEQRHDVSMRVAEQLARASDTIAAYHSKYFSNLPAQLKIIFWDV